MEYLTDMVTTVPEGTSPVKVDELRAAEAVRAAELAKAGHLVRLWRPPLGPGEWRSIGLFRAADEAELREVLASLPDRKSTRLNSSHTVISYAVFCLKKKKRQHTQWPHRNTTNSDT